MSSALVTGVTGQDGFYLARRLLTEGHTVFGLVRPGDPEAQRLLVELSGIQLVTADLLDRASVVAAMETARPEEIYHLAGLSSVALSWQDPVLAGQVTGLGAVAVMDAARSVVPEARMVFASSAEVFAGAADGLIDESSAISPSTPYGAAKAYGHLMARVLRSQGAFIATTILFNHESPRRPEVFVTRKISATAARIARGLESTMVLGNLEARRDWGWAPDYVDAMIRTARHTRPEEFVIATGVSHSVADFARAALASAGVENPDAVIAVDPAFMRSGDAPALIGNPSRAMTELGWKPSKTFEEVVAAMVEHDLALLEG